MEKLNDLFKYYVDNENFSGVGFVSRGNEVLYHESYGYAHRGFNVLNKLNTRFDTASITKLFTATAILQLIEEHLLDFSDSVIKVLGLQGTKISKEVTIFQLLTHSSGIADDADEEMGEDYTSLFINKPNYSIRQTLDFLPQFIYKKAKFNPGEMVSYNNVGYVLLGLVIEKLRDMTYREYVKQFIFDKIGMNDSGFFSKDETYSNVAEGYEFSEGKWKKNIYAYPPIGSPDGGAYCTAKDLAVFFQKLNEGKLLGKEMTELIMKPQLFYKKKDDFTIMMGYGFEFKVNHQGEIEYIRKDGLNTGVTGMLSYYPKKDVTIVLLTNQYCNVWKLSNQISELL